MADTLTPVGIIEQAQINNNLYNIASTAYAECSTGANAAVKEIALPGFSLTKGVTIHVKFLNSNSASTAPSLKINGSVDSIPIKLYGTENAGTNSETTGWQAGAVLSLTYDGNNWIRDQGYNTNTTYTIKDTYTSTDGNPISGKGVKAALETLDVSNISGFGADKTLSALSETDGKISASFQSIQIAESAVTNLTTHLGEKAPINNPTFTGTVTLPGDPTSNLHAATKKYVDDKTAGLSGAMHFKGTTTTEMTDGRTTAAVTINNSSYTPTSGDVVIYSDSEFVWTGSAWERLGRDSSFALDSSVIHKSDYDAVGDLMYGTGDNTYTILSGNTANSEKVLMMKGTGTVAAAPSWTKLGINKGTGSFPTLNSTITTEFLTASNAALTTGTAYSIPNVTKMATASVTNDAILVIESGTMGDNISVTNITGIDKTKKAAAATAVSLSGGTWPTPTITYT